MNTRNFLNVLNPAQREAVTAPSSHVLVLAGAGSGKTRVLIHRIAWLIHEEKISPYSILAVTFTNKAANEMRARLESLLQMPLQGLWVGTFHGIAHRLLRSHWREAGLPEGFQILDSDDQLRMIKRIIRSLDIDENQWQPKQMQGYINARKEEGLRAAKIAATSDSTQTQLVRIYSAYEAACRQAGLVDFTELLLRSLELLKEFPEIREQYQQRFRHLLIDEFQDTNPLQYVWFKALAGTSPVFAVGDDDQSIYGWRGARVEHIRDFQRDFKTAMLVRLEQNYRSTSIILKAANALIANNEGRLGKELWTEEAGGEPIEVYQAYNDLDEARYIANRVKFLESKGRRRDEIAILYRSNAQSRVIEEALIASGIPYRVYGGQRFFDRAEVKNALAYLRLALNCDDDSSFERIVNIPPRGIGERTLQQVRDVARKRQMSLWNAVAELLEKNNLSGRAMAALRGFLELVSALKRESEDLSLEEQVNKAVHASGLLTWYGRENNEKSQARIDNLEELVNAARVFRNDSEVHESLSPLTAFLTHAALEAGEGEGGSWEDCVQLMTLHSAKGLEFPYVIMTGMEDGLFPHRMSLDESSRLEEERRLCYVGITRARRALVMTAAETRRMNGQQTQSRLSRFLGEIPEDLIEFVRAKPKILSSQEWRSTSLSEPARRSFVDENHSDLRLGHRVHHQRFGEGVVTDFEGQGEQARVEINFSQAGRKWLIINYANLQPLD